MKQQLVFSPPIVLINLVIATHKKLLEYCAAGPILLDEIPVYLRSEPGSLRHSDAAVSVD